MSITPEQAHWGVAAYVFSLDLGADLAALAVPACPWEVLRPAIRTTILENRASVEAGQPPALLRDTLAEVLLRVRPDSAARTALSGFADWIERRFVTEGRRGNADHWMLAPLRDPALLARVDAALRPPGKTGPGYAAMLHAAVDPDASDTLLAAVFAADGRIDAKALTQWDDTLIARIAQVHAPENPLAALTNSLTVGLILDAAARLQERLGPERTAQVQALCRPEPAP